MTFAKPIKIAVFGAGAVGCYYGGMLARAGHAVTLIGRPIHVDAVRRAGLRLETQSFDANLPLTASCDAASIAGEAGVSEAMVVKITKKLGFAGFREFRNAVALYNQLPTSEMHQELSPDDTSEEIIQKVFHTSIHALQETLAILDVAAFDRAETPERITSIGCAAAGIASSACFTECGKPRRPLSLASTPNALRIQGW